MRMDEEIWDAVVVGAGPAGSVSAALLAERGWRVLLLEKSHWPREKVCGGCVNAAALEMLREMGMVGTLTAANRLNCFLVRIGKRELSLPLPEGIAIPREELDRRLVEQAIQRGCTFIPSACAALLPQTAEDFRQLKVSIPEGTRNLCARILLACDGIAGNLLQQEPWAQWRIAKNSRFGVATALSPKPEVRTRQTTPGDTGVRSPQARASCSHLIPLASVPHATITMHIAKTKPQKGYVGSARYADGRIHIAAALDPYTCRQAGGPATMIEQILQQNGISANLQEAHLHGTGLLTRQRTTVGGHRVLAVGDACGYVEPFTGEGIAWAIQSAREAVALLTEHHAPHAWPAHMAALWLSRHRATILRRQRSCRLLRQLVRHPLLAESTLLAANCIPLARNLAESFARTIGQGVQGVVHDQA